MKKLIVKSVHALFRIPVFERILRVFIKGRYVDSFFVKLVPGHHTYPQPSYRHVKSGPLSLHGNIHDYNDWKSYWGIKEIEREQLYKLAGRSRNIVDIGANNGWVLMNLSTIVSANKGMVYGFEPHPDSYERCMRNIASSGISNCQVYNLGCGIEDEEKVMTPVNKSNSGQNKIIDTKTGSAVPDSITVKVTTLDAQLKNVEKIDLIKIDVEGFELNVLKGAKRILTEDRPVLFMEVDDKLLRSNHVTPKELLSYLEDLYGYSFIHATSGEKVLVTDDFTGCHFDVICYLNQPDIGHVNSISKKKKTIAAA
jgi:FkbM family methyltransferase